MAKSLKKKWLFFGFIFLCLTAIASTGFYFGLNQSHTIDAKVLVVGGYGCNGRLDMEILDLSKHHSRCHSNVPLENLTSKIGTNPTFSFDDLEYFASAPYNGSHYILTGGGKWGQVTTETFLYDSSTNKRTPLASLKYGRWIHTAGVLRDSAITNHTYVIVVGGYDKDAPLDSVEFLSEVKGEWQEGKN